MLVFGFILSLPGHACYSSQQCEVLWLLVGLVPSICSKLVSVKNLACECGKCTGFGVSNLNLKVQSIDF